MFSKILIANRGEIAVRIIRACKEMGIMTTAIYSSLDKDSLHVQMADEAFCIGGASLLESYLNMDAIIMLAEKTGADAIHPGYGLLSENSEFAKKCEEKGIIFIGPSSDVIRMMGCKEKARALAVKTGVPVLPGSDIVEDLPGLFEVAATIGYPLMLKARAGGGGKGIRVVNDASELESAWNQVKAEAKNAFGDDAVFAEKYLTDVRHIEIQLMADRYGNMVTFPSRDCSVQKNNQKLIEESPACNIDNRLEAALKNCATRMAKASGYLGVGTIEFLVNGKDYYFLEMNTRLQVEHSVTEMVTGVDIVKWQIRIAMGLELDFKEKDIKSEGHGIECRICSLTGQGSLEFLHVPGGMNIRFDSALIQGAKINPIYDPMIGKLIVSAHTRTEAIRKMKAALCELVLAGVENNRNLHIKILSNDAFSSGTYNTRLYKEVN